MFTIDSSWTLFLDRDGVINERLPGAYVQNPVEFVFTEGCREAIKQLAQVFPRILVVTNQQGVGKGLMEEGALIALHRYMLRKIHTSGGRIDGVYYCTALAADHPACRKPNPGMAHQAKADFPEIDFSKSIMVGDSISDMEFGQRLGMKTVWVEGKEEERAAAQALALDARVANLAAFADLVNPA